MNRLWEVLSKRGWFFALLAVLFALALALWTGWNPAESRLLQPFHWLGYWWIAVILVAWFLYAFTNIFPRDWEERTKGHGVVWERRSSMVSFSYVFAILILLSPLWSRTLIGRGTEEQRRLEEQKEADYPIAIVRGCVEPLQDDSDGTSARPDLKSVPKEVRCKTNADQWLINIGGTIVEQPKPSAPVNQTVPGKEPEGGKKPTQANAPGKPPVLTASTSSAPHLVKVYGGLVVPLYFVIVALMGGAVSLLRRVPEIQRRSEHDYVGTEKEPKLSPGEVRERLGFQIIQFISAPLIAVAAYHAIGPESKTASVALAFSSGFASESILLMIRGVVEGIKPQSVTQQPAKGNVSGMVADQKTKQPVPNAALSIIGHPALTGKSDANGLFAIDGIPIGDQVIDATLNSQNAKVKVNIGASKTALCRIELP